MGPGGSVSRLIDGLVVGDAAAIRQLWVRYCHRLVGLARKKLADTPRRVADEEDVAKASNSITPSREADRQSSEAMDTEEGEASWQNCTQSPPGGWASARTLSTVWCFQKLGPTSRGN
jgi:hypothetical protein